jgi:hypothetical protein
MSHPEGASDTCEKGNEQVMKIWQRIPRSGRQLIKRLLLSNVHLARRHYFYHRHQESLERPGDPVVLYQMGKVGSKTIQRSLEALNLDRPLYHVHFLQPERVRKIERERQKYLGTEKEGLLRHVWLYQYLNRQMARGLDGKRWKVVTLTREPIGRNISTFFENLDVTPLDAGRRYQIQSDYYGFEIVLEIENVDELIELFFERLYHDRPLVFFDEEIKGVLGIDVFAGPFPTARGYQIFERERADVLLIRLENLNGCATNAFGEFLGLEGFTLVNANIGSQKIYAPLYERFKRSIVLPQSYVERMYGSKYMRHFYSPEEIARFRSKWRTKS